MGVYVLGGPVEYWWGVRWHSPEHYRFLLWVAQIQSCLVEAGHLVYTPNRAFRGAWNDRMQKVNDLAIKMSDGFIYTTPPGVVAYGTQAEVNFAMGTATPTFHCPPGDASKIKHLLLPLDDPYAKVKAKEKPWTRGPA